MLKFGRGGKENHSKVCTSRAVDKRNCVKLPLQISPLPVQKDASLLPGSSKDCFVGNSQQEVTIVGRHPRRCVARPLHRVLLDGCHKDGGD